ncbi:MAG: hypothetical protein ACLP04_07400 [Solirubrobacteraceae bacterium]
MTAIQFVSGMARLAGIVLPALIAAHLIRRRWLNIAGPVGVLAEVVLAFSLVLVVAEALGLVGLMRSAALIPVLVLFAGIVWWIARGRTASTALSVAPSGVESQAKSPGPSSGSGPGRDPTTACALVAVVVVSAQWCVQTANALGTGMANFDTLWYHMPFAAHMAQTGAVTGIQFTQADPFVAYYPANSELFHAIGIVALHNDFLSPLLNLVWLAVALLAAWCLGRPWRVQRLTLIAGCVVTSLPVLSGTQPGEAFNDIVGLAMLLVGVAVMVNAAGDRRLLAVAGLALGIAVGTKFTFVIPAFVLVAGIVVCSTRGSRRRVLGALALPLALTSGWWYLRNLIAVGNPEGLQLRLGPLTLPGPTSPLESASQQTVFSQISHLSLWGSRFAPGLDHALGPLWPLVLVIYVAAVVTGILIAGDSIVRVLAITAAVTGISYLFLPTGASAIEQGTTLFQVNLRYATPALALGIMLVPIILRLRIPRMLGALGPALVAVLIVAQLEHSLWPSQPARHLIFLLAATVLAVAIFYGRAIPSQQPRSILAVAALGLLLAVGGATFMIQPHYFNRRYLTGDETEPVLGVIYGWAQHVSHARIALYGNVQQYPLYGARDTNEVDYLGMQTSGGFRPIATCQNWRTIINRGHYRYVVLTPAPTAPVPIAWTQTDPAAHLLLRPAANAYVFEVTGKMIPGRCA